MLFNRNLHLTSCIAEFTSCQLHLLVLRFLKICYLHHNTFRNLNLSLLFIRHKLKGDCQFSATVHTCTCIPFIVGIYSKAMDLTIGITNLRHESAEKKRKGVWGFSSCRYLGTVRWASRGQRPHLKMDILSFKKLFKNEFYEPILRF